MAKIVTFKWQFSFECMYPLMFIEQHIALCILVTYITSTVSLVSANVAIQDGPLSLEALFSWNICIAQSNKWANMSLLYY